MASQPDVLRSCLQEAAKAARPALERCIDHTVSALQVAETQSLKVKERDELATAWRDLLANKPAWLGQYPEKLLAAFEQSAAAVGKTASPAIYPTISPVAARVGTPATAGRSAPVPQSHASFSLVADADVSQAIESARLLQQVLPEVEQILSELNKLISDVQGLPQVRPELNPLRPEIFTNTLRAMLSSAPVAPAVLSLWIRYLSDPLGRELQRVYERVVNRLEMAQVQGVNYRVVQAGVVSGGSRQGHGGGRANAGTGPGAGADPGTPAVTAAPHNGYKGYASDEAPARLHSPADFDDQPITDAMLRDFLRQGAGRKSPSAARTGASDDTPTGNREARDTTPPGSGFDSGFGFGSVPQAEARTLPRADGRESPASRVKLGDPQTGQREPGLLRDQLRKEAREMGQVLGLEVVHKLVSHVVKDARLLPPLREAIASLEPALLRLAMVDPHFFNDEGHPARRLLERVVQRSFRYDDERAPEFLEFFEPVKHQCDTLNALKVKDAQPFTEALGALENGWDEEDQREAEHRQRVVAALRFAEERQLEADRIATALSTRSDLKNVPDFVLDFLLGPWALAMAQAKLADTRNQVDPMGLGSVVPDLLWSVKRDVTLKRPAKLIEMIPGLLARLNAGLGLLGQDPRESEPFFDGLMKLHQPVLNLRRAKSQRDAGESGAIPLEPDEVFETSEFPSSATQRRARAAAQPWLAWDDLDAAGFEDTLATAPAELAPLGDEPHEAPNHGAVGSTYPDPSDDEMQTSAPLATEQEPPTEAGEVLLNLRPGTWVDMYSKRRWLRAQLVWASQQGTLFMFVSHGGQPHSMTKRSCERLIRDQLLRPVDSHGVVNEALDALLAQTAPAEPAMTTADNRPPTPLQRSAAA